MELHVAKQIYEKIKENLSEDISFERVLELIETTEKNLGYQLTGYGAIDKPYNQFYNEEALNLKLPAEKISILVLQQAQKIKSKIAYRCGRDITFDEFYNKVINCARSLKEMGIKRGDFITMCVPSTPEAIYLFFAANLLGAITRPIDPISSPNQVAANVMATNSKLLVTMDINYSKYKEVLEKTNLTNVIALSINDSLPKGINVEKLVVNIGTLMSRLVMSMPRNSKDNWLSFDDFIQVGEHSKYKDSSLDDLKVDYIEDETMSVFSTSGSTGEPRGVCITDKNIIASVYKQIASNFRVTTNDTLYNPMPTCSSYFWDDIVFALIYGVTTTLSPLFNAEKSAKAIINASCSVTLAGPLILEKLNEYIEMSQKKKQPVDMSFLRHIISGGDLLSIDLERKTNHLLKQSGSLAVVENGLGTSETCGPAVSPNGFMENPFSYEVGSVGVVLPGDDVAIFRYDSENNSRDISSPDYDKGLLYYEIGEICFLADNGNVFKEYYNDSKNTQATKIRHNDGKIWYHTGDLGYMDPTGKLYCYSRKTGLIIRDGHKIWAPKIENIVKMFKDIEDCAVIGVPDIKDKEAPVLFIVFSSKIEEPQKELVKKQIMEKIAIDIDNYHLPLQIIELSEIPRNLMLKTRIGELLSIYTSEYAMPKENSSFSLRKTIKED